MESAYDPAETVWRAELRFSHSVINQFAKANDVKLNTFGSVITHLGGLWRYGLKNFRYDYSTKFVHPAWTVLMEESGFDQYEAGFVYRSEYKIPGVGNEMNVAFALGNMLPIYARHKFSAKKLWNASKSQEFIWIWWGAFVPVE